MFLAISLVSIFSSSENTNPTEINDSPSLPINIVSTPPCNNPIWHPNDKFIGFNHTPLDSITYPFGENYLGDQHFNNYSTGFWLINIDGSNQRRVLSYELHSAQWSPNGERVVFVRDAQIYKMPCDITEEKFDTTGIEKITFEGRNFDPAWNPDGKYIAYRQSVCDELTPCGIWLVDSDGINRKFIAAYGNNHAWKPINSEILYLTRAISKTGEVFGDSVWVYNLKEGTNRFYLLL